MTLDPRSVYITRASTFASRYANDGIEHAQIMLNILKVVDIEPTDEEIRQLAALLEHMAKVVDEKLDNRV